MARLSALCIVFSKYRLSIVRGKLLEKRGELLKSIGKFLESVKSFIFKG